MTASKLIYALLDFNWTALTVTLCIVASVLLAVTIGLFVALVVLNRRRDDMNDVSSSSPAPDGQTEKEKEPEPAPAPAAVPVKAAKPKQPAKAVEKDAPDTAEELAEDEEEEPVRLVVRDNRYVNVRYNKSFEAQLIQSGVKNKEYYSAIKNELLAYGAVSGIGWLRETFYFDKKKIAVLCMRGKTLCLYLALDANNYKNTKYYVHDASEQEEFQEVPCLYRIKNDFRCRYAKDLIAALGLSRKATEKVNYTADYQFAETSVLIVRGLIKIDELNERGEVIESVEEQAVAASPEVAEAVPAEEIASAQSEAEPEIAEVALAEEIVSTQSEAEPEVVEETIAEEVVPTQPEAEPVAEEAEEEEDEPDAAEELSEEEPEPVRVIRRDNRFVNVRYDRSFTARLIQSSDTTKGYYTAIKNELIAHGAKARMSWRQESFRVGRRTVAILRMRGKTLYLYLALNPADYEGTKYLVNDVSDKNKYRSVPCLYRIKNDRRCRYAKDLIAALGLVRKDVEPVDYGAGYPYEETDPLIERGLIKLVEVVSGESSAEEENEPAPEVAKELPAEEIVSTQSEAEVVEELPAEEAESAQPEPVAEEAEEEEDEPDTAEELLEEADTEPVRIIRRDDHFVNVRYDKSFTARLIQSDERTKGYYTAIKNELIAHGAKARVSWRQESFRVGRRLVAMLRMRGKTLYLYLALNPADYEGTKYLVNDVSDKNKYRDVPCLYRIKNDRRCRYAKDLIAALGLVKKEIEPVDYGASYPYEETDPLIHRGLIKLVETTTFTAEAAFVEAAEAPVEEPVEESAPETVEEPVEEPVPETVEEPVEEPAPETVEEPVEEPVPETVEESVEEPAPETVEESVEEPAPETVEEPVEEPVPETVEEPVEEPAPEPVVVKAAEVKALMQDEEAKQLVEESIHYSDKSKQAVVNVDTLGEYFKDGERVTLEEMKKRIPYLSAKTTYVKVLARGSLNKALEVEADDFSLDAVKMIALAGGKVYRKRTQI